MGGYGGNMWGADLSGWRLWETELDGEWGEDLGPIKEEAEHSGESSGFPWNHLRMGRVRLASETNIPLGVSSASREPRGSLARVRHHVTGLPTLSQPASSPSKFNTRACWDREVGMCGRNEGHYPLGSPGCWPCDSKSGRRLSYSVSENNTKGSPFGHLQEFLILDAGCLQRPQLPCDDDTWEVAFRRVPGKVLRLKDSPTRIYAGQPGTSQVHWGSLAPQFSERVPASHIERIQHLSILISWVIYEPQTSKTSLFLSIYLCQTWIVNKLCPPFTHSFSKWTEGSPRRGAAPGLI